MQEKFLQIWKLFTNTRRHLNFVKKFPTQCRKNPTNLETIYKYRKMQEDIEIL